MISGISAALNGFTAAVTRLNASASTIASQSSTQTGGSHDGADNADIARPLINATIASYDAQANLKTLQTQDDLTRQAINIIR